MDFNKFISLNQKQQLDVLIKKGVFLYQSDSLESTEILYQLEGFYVEVQYDNVNEKVIKLSASSSVDFLEPYLSRFDIPKFLKKIVFMPFLEALDIVEPIVVYPSW